MGAPFGNANGAKQRMFYDKLRLVLTQEPHRLRQIAEQLVSKAEQGEAWAIKELIDRVDGKSVQAMTVANEDGSPLLAGIRVEFIRPGSTPSAAPAAAPEVADGSPSRLP
jgi:hypothetical protein